MDSSQKKLAAEQQSTSWDPYEVWRTRVLQPRLDKLANRDVAAKTSVVKLRTDETISAVNSTGFGKSRLSYLLRLN
jgi:hypothetical protein